MIMTASAGRLAIAISIFSSIASATLVADTTSATVAAAATITTPLGNVEIGFNLAHGRPPTVHHPSVADDWRVVCEDRRAPDICKDPTSDCPGGLYKTRDSACRSKHQCGCSVEMPGLPGDSRESSDGLANAGRQELRRRNKKNKKKPMPMAGLVQRAPAALASNQDIRTWEIVCSKPKSPGECFKQPSKLCVGSTYLALDPACKEHGCRCISGGSIALGPAQLDAVTHVAGAAMPRLARRSDDYKIVCPRVPPARLKCTDTRYSKCVDGLYTPHSRECTKKYQCDCVGQNARRSEPTATTSALAIEAPGGGPSSSQKASEKHATRTRSFSPPTATPIAVTVDAQPTEMYMIVPPPRTTMTTTPKAATATQQAAKTGGIKARSPLPTEEASSPAQHETIWVWRPVCTTKPPAKLRCRHPESKCFQDKYHPANPDCKSKYGCKCEQVASPAPWAGDSSAAL
ncbi:hypothetical protein JDV02_008729 [Purpureocillium takamizusanense]|uniref:Uncharacterized protein n=1 Tax=Purpureocillium takamizusanense TaxID=2060973 RepID=A0A9Q8QKS3_9HYPO|nr:uncharacterized protein JDV02_008729 [Purpureocillium takamizusanense]UNI22884.1 hypothetical protein JDV02_008729 [Purpureocillium takamizusanense]